MGKIVFIAIALLSLFYCCSLSSSRIENEIKTMTENSIDLSLKDFYAVGINDCESGINEKYKMVVYSDTSDCSGCYINHLKRWNDLLHLEKDTIGLKFYFIVEARMNETKDLIPLIKNCGLNHTVYIDKNFSFRNNNKFIPEESLFHTFLLDHNNKVILVGNPLTNEKIEKLFFKTIMPKK